MINPDRPLSLAEAGRQDVENALALMVTLLQETTAIAERTNPDPAARAPFPNGALYWLATRQLEHLSEIHTHLGRRHAAITALLSRPKE